MEKEMLTESFIEGYYTYYCVSEDENEEGDGTYYLIDSSSSYAEEHSVKIPVSLVKSKVTDRPLYLRNGDLIYCKISIVQFMRKDTFFTQYEIVSILQHWTAINYECGWCKMPLTEHIQKNASYAPPHKSSHLCLVENKTKNSTIISS